MNVFFSGQHKICFAIKDKKMAQRNEKQKKPERRVRGV